MFTPVFVMFRPAIAAGVSVLLLTAGSARGGDPNDRGVTVNADPDIVTRDVTIADLDLARAADQRILRHRINVAARHVCSDVAGNAGLVSDMLENCYREAVVDAQADVQMAVRAAATQSRDVFAIRVSKAGAYT